MNVCFIKDREKIRKYTDRTLTALCEAFGVDIVEADQADVILVSIDDPDDLNLLKRARRIAGERPLIAGGFEAFGGEWILAFADAVNVGEGFEFFEALGSARDVRDLYELPFVLTRDKAIVYPSTRIDIDKLPLVRIGKKLWYYLAGRGCKGKCAFCMTSFVYPHWHNPQAKLRQAIDYVEARGHRLTLITNDSSEINVRSKSRLTQSVRVRDYLKDPARFKGAGMLHLGIEGWTEQQRRDFGKPISDEAIRELIGVLGEQRQAAELFFIIGLPGTFDAMMAFAESVPVSAEAYPKLYIKLTRLDPSAHTPLWSYDLRQLEPLGAKRFESFHRAIKARNIRFRLFPARADARHLWRGVLTRCAPDEVAQLGTEPKTVSEADFVARLESRDLGHLLTYDGRPMPASQIVTPWRVARDKMAARLNMPEVAYKSDLVLAGGGHDTL